MNHPARPMAALRINPTPKANIGHMLVELGKLTQGNVERILRVQEDLGLRFGETARRLGLITEADIQQVLAKQFDYPYLQAGQGEFPAELVAAYQPFSPQVEMLRAVRFQLMMRWFSTGHKALAIASVDSGEGASFLAANLAVVFSQLGEQTLLVDANLRQPRQHQIFKLEGRHGLSDVLVNRAGLEVISRVNSFADLSVLPAGTIPPNPQELVSCALFGNLTDSLASQCNIVLYDVPAFSSGADALAICARVGGVLLVARKQHTRLPDLNAIGEQLGRNGAEVVGSVLVDF